MKAKFDERNRELNFRLFELSMTKLNQEGDGIWNRFSILITLNLAFMGAYFGLTRPATDIGYLSAEFFFAPLHGLVGMFVSIYSYIAIRRLWMWHEHWLNNCKQIEELLPSEMPKLLVSARFPQNPIRHQTVFAIFFLIWLALFILPFLGRH
jgi:hypothetical protein